MTRGQVLGGGAGAARSVEPTGVTAALRNSQIQAAANASASSVQLRAGKAAQFSMLEGEEEGKLAILFPQFTETIEKPTLSNHQRSQFESSEISLIS